MADGIQNPETPEKPAEAPRRADRRTAVKSPWMRRFVVYAFLLMSAFGLGVLLFNSVIMPAFVGHREEVRVPDVSGKELTAAEALIAKSGLKLGETRRRHDRAPAGTIIAQNPSPGTAVKNRRSIILTVSLGEQGSVVPNLAGESLRNVEIALGSADLTVGQVFHVPSTTVASEAVIATEPPAGAGAVKGTAVNILMSAGGTSPGYLMPDLRGLDATEVERRLTDAGFEVEVQGRGGIFGGGRRKVSDHVPEPGARVWGGGKVTLYTD